MEKLMHRDVRKTVQGHTAHTWQSQHSSWGSQVPKPMLFINEFWTVFQPQSHLLI